MYKKTPTYVEVLVLIKIINYLFFNIGNPVLEFSITCLFEGKSHPVDLESFEKK